MISVKIDSRWIGLHGPQSLILWIQNELRGHRQHQEHPDPADGAMRQRALWRGELDDAEHKGRHRRESVDGDFRCCVQQWGETHARSLTLADPVRQRQPAVIRPRPSIRLLAE